MPEAIALVEWQGPQHADESFSPRHSESAAAALQVPGTCTFLDDSSHNFRAVELIMEVVEPDPSRRDWHGVRKYSPLSARTCAPWSPAPHSSILIRPSSPSPALWRSARPFYRDGLITRRDVVKSAYAQLVFRLGGADEQQMAKIAIMCQVVSGLAGRAVTRSSTRLSKS